MLSCVCFFVYGVSKRAHMYSCICNVCMGKMNIHACVVVYLNVLHNDSACEYYCSMANGSPVFL